MTEPVYLCDCEHPKAAHHGSAYACRLCQRCTRFTRYIQRAAREAAVTDGLDADLAELEASDPVVAAAARSLDEVTADILAIADQINPEPTLADLARVEQERDELIECMPCGWCNGVGVVPEERFGRDADGAPMVDGLQPCPEGCEVVPWLEAERNDAADTEKERDEAVARLKEMATFRAEAIDAVRRVAAARDLLQAELHRVKGKLSDAQVEGLGLVGEVARVERERDQLAARLHAAYEALYIEEFDGDSCPDLETTIAYAISAYRRVCDSEAKAAEQIDLLRAERQGYKRRWSEVSVQRDIARAELSTARGELEQLREDLRIKARMVANLNHRLTLTGALATDLTELLGEQGWQGTLVARDGGRYCERCEQEIERDHAYEQVPGTDWAELVHRHCPTSKEKSTHG